MSDDGVAYMRRALELAARGLFTTDPNPRVGCVLVREGRIVGQGWHQRAGEGHAEVNALIEAGAAARGATAYVTLEPCCFHGRTGPCTEALLQAGITEVVAAMRDPNPKVGGQGLERLAAAGISVRSGLMEQEARALNPGFIMRMTHTRPFVRCKLATSLDGRTAMASGESQWITGADARADVQRLRARSSAVITGSGTVITDDPSLTVRIPQAQGRQPLRVVLDSSHRVSPRAKLFEAPHPVLLVAARRRDVTGGDLNDAPRAGRDGQAAGASTPVPDAFPDNAEHITLPALEPVGDPPHEHGIDLNALMDELARREVNEAHLECGARLAGGFLRAGLIDELVVYLAPVIMGDAARGSFHLPGLAHMSDRIHLELTDVTQIGADLRLTLRPAAGTAGWASD